MIIIRKEQFALYKTTPLGLEILNKVYYLALLT